MTGLGDLEVRLAGRLTPEAAAWLEGARAAAGEEPAALRTLFPVAARRVGRGPLEPGADGPWDVTVDEAARVLLLAAAGAGAEAELGELYRYGDSREKRAVLHALGVLPVPPETARPLALDALRTNEPPLVAGALSARVVDALDDGQLQQAVLKCVFVGLGVDRVPGLAGRLTPALSRALAGFLLERVVAGRSTPADVWWVVDAHPPHDLLDALEAELASPTPQRRAAAEAALALRPPGAARPRGARGTTADPRGARR